MKLVSTLAACIAALLSLNGCVSRTITQRPEIRGAKGNPSSFGNSSKPIHEETKIIWFWQDEFRNP